MLFCKTGNTVIVFFVISDNHSGQLFTENLTLYFLLCTLIMLFLVLFGDGQPLETVCFCCAENIYINISSCPRVNIFLFLVNSPSNKELGNGISEYVPKVLPALHCPLQHPPLQVVLHSVPQDLLDDQRCPPPALLQILQVPPPQSLPVFHQSSIGSLRSRHHMRHLRLAALQGPPPPLHWCHQYLLAVQWLALDHRWFRHHLHLLLQNPLRLHHVLP